jgi:hypothetical protein
MDRDESEVVLGRKPRLASRHVLRNSEALEDQRGRPQGGDALTRGVSGTTAASHPLPDKVTGEPPARGRQSRRAQSNNGIETDSLRMPRMPQHVG